MASAWSLVMTIGELLGGVPRRSETLDVQVTKSGYPPVFDEAHGAVVISFGRSTWFGSESPGSPATQLYLWASIVSTLMAIAIAGMVFLLCLTILRRRPFTRTMTWFIGCAGLILVVGGVVSQVLAAWSRWMLVDGMKYLGPPNGVTVPDPTWTIDFAPIIAGLVLGAIAAAFEIGTRLQRDTDGLV